LRDCQKNKDLLKEVLTIKDLVIFGAGNFGREVTELVNDINKDKKQWNLLGYIDETIEKQGAMINKYRVLGNFDWLEQNSGFNLWTVCAVANPKDKFCIINKLAGLNVKFANLIHPVAKLSKTVQLGIGNIICWNTFLSTDTRIGNHVALNPGCGIGHDTVIEDYSTLYWEVTLSGNVKINEGCEIGTKAVVIPKKVVGKWSVLGAGAVVVKDIPDNSIAVGVPAKTINL
jgi:sugar O-acyltransferase (sialic acid O-acetyltransferase NeuD family)